MNSDLELTVAYLQGKSLVTLAPAHVVEALLATEKQAKQDQPMASYADLIGDWRLGFVTGTRRARQQAGVALGAGRFLPRWVAIHLAYDGENVSSNRGTVRNTVRLGGLQLCLTGPTEFIPKSRILAFDFTQMTITIAGATVYKGFIRNGQQREAEFSTLPLKEKAFFSYFLLTADAIAARGRGGGLALWVRAD